MIKSVTRKVGVGGFVAALLLAASDCHIREKEGGTGGASGSSSSQRIASSAGGAAATSSAAMGGATAATTGAGGTGGSGGGSLSMGPWSHAGDLATESFGNAVAVDLAENVIAVGYFKGTIDFGTGPVAGAGGKDAFAVKFNRRGKPLWTRAFTGVGEAEAKAIAADASGDLYVAGVFTGSVDFGVGQVTSAGGYDAFLVKLDPAGSTLWARTYGDAQDQDITSLAVDVAGNVFFTGTMKGSVDFGTGPIPCGCANAEFAAYLAKIDPFGGAAWAKVFLVQGGGRVAPGGVAVDPSNGAVVLAGGQSGPVDFGGGPVGGIGSVFVARFLPSGALASSTALPGSKTGCSVQAVAVDGAGNIGLAGYFVGKCDLGGGPLYDIQLSNTNAFVAKLTSGGSHVFSARWGDLAGGNNAQSSFVNGAVFDAAGDLLVIGYVPTTADFGGGPVSPVGNFLTTLGPTGSLIEAKTQLMGNLGLALDAAGRPLVTGTWTGPGDIGSGVVYACGTAGAAAFVADIGPGTPVRGCTVDADCVQGLTCQGGYCRCPSTMCPPAKVACFPYTGSLAVDANDVYFVAGDAVEKAAIDGGNPFLFAMGQQNVQVVRVDATDVFWGTNGTVMTAPKTGGAPVTLASNQSYVPSIAIDASNVYWSTTTGTVMQAPKGGGAAITLASGQGKSFVAVDATHVYWASSDGNTVMKVPIGGGAPVTLASGQQTPSGIALDATHVYWTNFTDGTVMKVPVGGGVPVTLASGLNGPDSIALDASDVYWTSSTDGTVMKVPVGGGAPMMLASGQQGPSGLALDATYAYWSASRIIMRVPK